MCLKCLRIFSISICSVHFLIIAVWDFGSYLTSLYPTRPGLGQGFMNIAFKGLTQLLLSTFRLRELFISWIKIFPRTDRPTDKPNYKSSVAGVWNKSFSTLWLDPKIYMQLYFYWYHQIDLAVVNHSTNILYSRSPK